MIGPIIFTVFSCLSIGFAAGWYAKTLLDAIKKDEADASKE